MVPCVFLLIEIISVFSIIRKGFSPLWHDISLHETFSRYSAPFLVHFSETQFHPVPPPSFPSESSELCRSVTLPCRRNRPAGGRMFYQVVKNAPGNFVQSAIFKSLFLTLISSVSPNRSYFVHCSALCFINTSFS